MAEEKPSPHENYRHPTEQELELRKTMDGRLLGLRVNRYSWWTHWRDLADYILPRRYKWLITPNMMARGSPINGHILDSTGTLAARNLAAGMMTGCTDPTKRWLRLRVDEIDSTQTNPISLWLAECERILFLIFQQSNFYNAMATLYFDLVVFGTAILIIYEDSDSVIHCYNPCAGEYYLDVDDKLEPSVMYREFTLTISQVVEKFGEENVSPGVWRQWKEGGPALTRELIIAHGVEPNHNAKKYGIPNHFKWRECYWEWGGSTSPQGGAAFSPGFLRKRGYHERPFTGARWDLVANDAYGRCPAMDALGDIRQLQHENRRKGQAIDKLVNPPLIADVQLKNQPASLLPGGITYIAGMMSQGRPGMAPVYTVMPPVKEIMEDLNEVRDRIKRIFYNDLFQTISQFETRSNVTATEIDARRAEAMVMLGPVLERLDKEVLAPSVERTFKIAQRAGIMPPAPAEIQGLAMNIQFVSMLEQAQSAAQASGIERLFGVVGNLAGIDPQAADNVDIDYGLEKMNSLLHNDPKLIRSQQQLAQIRQDRQRQQQQAQQAEMAEKLSKGASNLANIDVGGGQTAAGAMMGAGGP